MFDGIDASSGCCLNTARAMGVGHDLKPKRVRGVSDRHHFFTGEMCFQASALLRQNAASGCDFDNVRAGA